MPVHDRLGAHQSGPAQQAPPVRPVPYDRSDRSQQRPARFVPPQVEYRVKEKKLEVQSEATPEKAKADTVVQIGEIKVVVQDKGKEPMVIDKSATSSAPPVQKPFTANNHEAGGSKVADKYHQPRWCPEGLTHTQKRKLQRLRNKEKREQEAEKARDEYFNKYRHMIPQGKVWQAKTIDQPSDEPVKPVSAEAGTICSSAG